MPGTDSTPGDVVAGDTTRSGCKVLCRNAAVTSLQRLRTPNPLVCNRATRPAAYLKALVVPRTSTTIGNVTLTLRATTHFWEWQLRARCRSIGSESFFGYDGETSGVRARREHDAIEICRPCTVRSECLSHSLATPELHGIWGGRTETERRRARATGRRVHSSGVDQARVVRR